jgi:hypothetical protein
MELGSAFVTVAKEHFKSKERRLRLRYFADEGNSFEGWFNWELYYAFATAYPWPEFTIRREHRFPGEAGLTDLVLWEGGDFPASARKAAGLFRIESKLIWDNGNRRKQIKSARRDFDRIRRVGNGLLVVVAVSANQANDNGVQQRDPCELLHELSAELPPASSPAMELYREDSKEGKAFYLAPRIRIAAYPV